ncbi:MAG: hypothetical protein M1504_00835 [Candidatus Marsarchaeota archaeon]|nr:hypothetical protein [Candidatus Marsarchaeota archaeon]
MWRRTTNPSDSKPETEKVLVGINYDKLASLYRLPIYPGEDLEKSRQGIRNAIVIAIERGREDDVTALRGILFNLMIDAYTEALKEDNSRHLDSIITIISDMEPLERLLRDPETATRNKIKRLKALQEHDSGLRSERTKRTYANRGVQPRRIGSEEIAYESR